MYPDGTYYTNSTYETGDEYITYYDAAGNEIATDNTFTYEDY